jgi:nitrite reductase (cytochrome c-552)
VTDIAAAARADSASPRLVQARSLHRKAQFFTDFVEAENSMGFHADQEAARILGRAIDYARRGQIALAGGDPGTYVPMLTAPPDTAR